jgi:hypothetical protein
LYARLVRRVLAALVVASIALGCRPGKTVEKEPMTERLSSWSSMSLEVVTSRPHEDLTELEDDLVKRAREERLLPVVDPHAADLRVRVIVREFEAGGVTDPARIVVDVELQDVRENRVVGRFEVKHKNEAAIDLEPMSRSERLRLAVANRVFAWLRAHR